ncbi:MAG: YkgJ family cysteine cluster protein [Candidatus Hodarchaeales archaeon]|jgi:Fe-S-cluster containining protein
MTDDKPDSDQKDPKINSQAEEEIKTEVQDSEEEKQPTKKKYVFNCTKCGQCCEKREYVPITLTDIREWTKSGGMNSIYPHIKMQTFSGKVGEEVREIVSLVLKGSEKGCPLYDRENKLCNIYHSMPLECLAFPLGYNGQAYFIKDKTVPGLGNGTMTKDQLIKDRDNARKEFEAQVDTQTIIPFTYTLFMQNLIEQQQKIRDEMPEEKRKQLDDLLKAEKPETN